MGQVGETVHRKLLFQPGKVIVKQVPEHLKIMFDKHIDRPVLGSHLFTDQRKGILIGNQKKSQVILPQIFIKGKIRGHRQELLHLAEHPAPQRIPAFFAVS